MDGATPPTISPHRRHHMLTPAQILAALKNRPAAPKPPKPEPPVLTPAQLLAALKIPRK